MKPTKKVLGYNYVNVMFDFLILGVAFALCASVIWAPRRQEPKVVTCDEKMQELNLKIAENWAQIDKNNMEIKKLEKEAEDLSKQIKHLGTLPLAELPPPSEDVSP